MHSSHEHVKAILTVLFDQEDGKKCLNIKEIRAKISCFWKVWRYSLFKLLKFIIVNFHLALILFCMENSFSIFLFIYIYMIWIHGYTVCKSLKLIQAVWSPRPVNCSQETKNVATQKFFRWNFLCEIVAKKEKIVFFMWYIWLLLRSCCTRRETLLR